MEKKETNSGILGGIEQVANAELSDVKGGKAAKKKEDLQAQEGDCKCIAIAFT